MRIGQTNNYICVAMVLAALAAAVSSTRPGDLYEQVHFLLVAVTASETASDAGAIGERSIDSGEEEHRQDL